MSKPSNENNVNISQSRLIIPEVKIPANYQKKSIKHTIIGVFVILCIIGAIIYITLAARNNFLELSESNPKQQLMAQEN
jgi:hypothetical protein